MGQIFLAFVEYLNFKEWFDKEQIGVKEPFPMTTMPIYFRR